MKAIKYWGAALGLLTLVACSKSELETANPVQQETETMAVTASNDANAAAKWSSVSNTGTGTEAVAFAGEIKDDAITEDVIVNGLVLVFGKTNSLVQSLPFQEKGNELRYWYYHVSQGSVFIQANSVSKSASVTTAQDFAVIVISKSQLENLESNGTSRDLLFGMSFDQVNALLN